jgi:hypothetical protein
MVFIYRHGSLRETWVKPDQLTRFACEIFAPDSGRTI